MLQNTVSQIARVPTYAVAMVRASAADSGLGLAQQGRRALASSSTTVAYTVTVTPRMVRSNTPAAAYGIVSQALQQSVQPPSASDSFTTMMVHMAHSSANSGVTSKSVAGSIQISAYNSLPPTMQPTSSLGSSSTASAAAAGNISDGTIVGIAFGVFGALLLAAVAYFTYARAVKDTIPARDVSMANIQRNNEPFDSEEVVSPLPPASPTGRKQSLIDIIPAAQVNPLAAPGMDHNRRL